MTAPITAEAFTAHGVDATTAADLAKQYNQLAGVGAPDNAVASPVSPAPSAPSAPPPAPSADASREMADIRSRRARGEISDNAWRTEYEPRMLQLAGVAEAVNARHTLQEQWDGTTAAQAAAHDAQFTKLLDKQMAPPRSPSEYNFRTELNATGETLAYDQALRTGLAKLGVPKSVAEAVDDSLHRVIVSELGRLGPEELHARVGEAQDALRRIWGDAYAQRWERLHAVMENASRSDPALETLARVAGPYIDADWQALHALSEWVEHRHRGRLT